MHSNFQWKSRLCDRSPLSLLELEYWDISEPFEMLSTFYILHFTFYNADFPVDCWTPSIIYLLPNFLQKRPPSQTVFELDLFRTWQDQSFESRWRIV